MLKKVRLQNFGRHADLTVNFTEGVNAIRGSNEAGKSTVLQAIGYALFGASALSRPIDRVVTYGVPVSKLRVELDFEYLGIEYSLYRAKSGAELTFLGERITGQTEVTKYVEKLFKADAKMAGQLMIAAQKKLAGEMTTGSVGAARLIEALADFDLLDVIKDLIQEHLPSGNTASLEGRIATLTAQAEPTALEDVAPLQEAFQAAAAAHAKAAEAVQDVRSQLTDLRAKDPAKVLAELKAARAAESNLRAKVEDLKARAAVPTPAAPSDAEMDKLIAAHEASKRVTTALVLHTELQAADTTMLWDEPRAALDAEVLAARARLEALSAREAEQAWTNRNIAGSNHIRDLQEAIKLAKMKIIQDNTCAFCQKDLTDVPEVVKINTDAAREIQLLEEQLAAFKATLTLELDALQKKLAEVNSKILEQLEECKALDNVVKVADRLAPLYAKAAEYIELDESVVPAQWKWIGPTSGNTDAAEKRFAAEKARREAEAHRGAVAEAQRQLTAVQGELAEVATQVAALAEKEDEAEMQMSLLADLADKEDTLRLLHTTANVAMVEAQRALQRAEVSNAAVVKAMGLAKEQLAAAHTELAETQANNLLVKKVAAARPTITDKLWNMVLGAASTYLSAMRGEVSAITRADGEFLVNGRPASDLSGSGEDCFGLALRVALTRTFIPTAPFLILDEPAAACSAEREVAMLGQIAALGFDQTIVITHSDLCESFANNLIIIE